MKSLIPLTVSILGLFVLPLLAPPETASKESGTIVSRLNRTLVIIGKDEKSTRQFDIPAETPILLDSKPAKLDDLQPGDNVEIAFAADKKVLRVDAKSGKVKQVLSKQISLEVGEARHHSPYIDVVTQ